MPVYPGSLNLALEHTFDWLPCATKPTSFGSAARSMGASATFYSCHASWWTSSGVRRSYGRLPRRLAADLTHGLLNLFVRLAFGTPTACRTGTYSSLSFPCKITPPNQSIERPQPLVLCLWRNREFCFEWLGWLISFSLEFR